MYPVTNYLDYKFKNSTICMILEWQWWIHPSPGILPLKRGLSARRWQFISNQNPIIHLATGVRTYRLIPMHPFTSPSSPPLLHRYFCIPLSSAQTCGWSIRQMDIKGYWWRQTCGYWVRIPAKVTRIETERMCTCIRIGGPRRVSMATTPRCLNARTTKSGDGCTLFG